jgi:hypothetical protein
VVLPRPDSSLVARLRLRGAAADPLAARLRLEAMLGAVGSPAALPPASILCLRRLDDPLPGALPLHGRALRPPPGWERALRDALDAGARRAARPAGGAVAAAADAVLFADLAELLACLARDVATGLAGARWWWRALYGPADLARALLDAWLAAPECAPPALDRLAREGAAAPLLAALGEPAARALTGAVARRHGCRPALEALDAPRPERDPPADARPIGAVVPEAAALDAGPEARTLLAVALLLRRAPALSRRADVGPPLAAVRWGAARLDVPWVTHARARPAADARAEAPAETRLPAPRRERAMPALGEPRRGTEPAAQRSAPPAARPPAPPPVEAASAADPRRAATAPAAPLAPAEAPASAAAPPRRAAATTEDAAPFVARDVDAAPRDAAPARERAAPPAPALEPTPLDLPASFAVDTDLGGLFYLVGVALSLGLYGDFTTPLEPGLELPIWDFVALLGRALLGEDAPDDALWPLLAALAGRDPGAPPGAGFAPPPGWRLPPAWRTAPADERAWDDDAASASPQGPADAPPLDRFIAWLAARVAARLGAALALDAAAALAPVLLRRRARVRVGDVRVDVHLALAELPIAVRLAGLDRDPGWLPAAGRALFFHFE